MIERESDRPEVLQEVLDAIDARLDQWGADDDLSDWLQPAKIIRGDILALITEKQQ